MDFESMIELKFGKKENSKFVVWELYHSRMVVEKGGGVSSQIKAAHFAPLR